MVNSITTNKALSNFLTERTSLETAAGIKFGASLTNDINYRIHENFVLTADELRLRLDGITGKFRACEMLHFLYFEGMDHDLLTATAFNLPLIRSCTFTDAGTSITKIFEVNDHIGYREVIDHSFQEFILFSAAILENLVYLSETLIRKVAIHLPNNRPQSILMDSFKTLLGYLHDLDYRNPTEPVQLWLKRHETFFDRFLGNINFNRNRFIHGYKTSLRPNNGEYQLSEPKNPLSAGSPYVNVEYFVKEILDNLRILIPDFFIALTDTITAARHLPA